MKRFALLLLACCGNPTTPVNPPDNDPLTQWPAGTASDCRGTCERLASVGCPEGSAPTCVEACDTAPSSHASAFSKECVNAAKSTTDLKVCGVRCLK